MYQCGVYFGRFLPPHRGHLYQIIEASTKCEKLYVILCDNAQMTRKLCAEDHLPEITYKLRKQWLNQQVQDMEHIRVLVLDEAGLDDGSIDWPEWAHRLKALMKDRRIDAFFAGEKEYEKILQTHFPQSQVEIFDPKRTRYPISATDIRKSILTHWDYILGPARPFFCKKVLIVGTESCGKTTLTKYLAKLYNTSWSEEVGRYYAREYLGGDETIYKDEDFVRMAHLQYEQDFHALRTANRVCFFDTDALITDYYSELYLGHENKRVQAYIDPSRYDLVLYLEPTVDWVDDGMRLNSDPGRRERLNERLKAKYGQWGFEEKMYYISQDNYHQRLNAAIKAVDALMG